jgi:hypothetical protein
VNALARYIELKVEPTFEDFKRNPRSIQHAFLACAAIYHAIDRVAYPDDPGDLRKEWQQKSFQFLIVDMVAHHFKHVLSDIEKSPTPANTIPLSFVVFGRGGPGTVAEAGEQMELRNLFFVVRDAIRFLHDQARAFESGICPPGSAEAQGTETRSQVLSPGLFKRRLSAGELEWYLTTIVEPTVDDFRRNPMSERHAYLACVALYHSIDRIASPQPAASLSQKWRQLSPAFGLVDIIAHDFKHVRSEWRGTTTTMKLARGSSAVLGRMGFNTHMLNDTGQRDALRSLVSVLDKALEFVWSEVRRRRNGPSVPQSRLPQAQG